MPFEIVVVMLVLLTLVVTTAMAVVGLIGLVGAIRLAPCPSCHHLVRSIPPSVSACPYCHYQRALHTLHLARDHHDGQQASVLHDEARRLHPAGDGTG